MYQLMPSTELSDANAGGNGRRRGEGRAGEHDGANAMGLVSVRSGPGDVAGTGPGTPWIRAFMASEPPPDALDSGFHDVPVGWAHPDQEVDGASVAWVQFRERAAWVRALAPPGCGH